MALGSLESLPPETIDNIASFLDTPDLSAFRLLNHYLETFAARWHFEEVRCRTSSFCRDRQAMVHIAKSTKLNQLVREVNLLIELPASLPFYPNLDVNIEETLGAMAWDDRHHFATAAHVLPFLSHFRHLTTLRLIFIENPEVEPNTQVSSDVISYQSGIIETIFQCLTGTWPLERQTRIDEALKLVLGDEYSAGCSAFPGPGPVSLRALWIKNLNVPLHSRVRKSEAFKAVVGSGSIVDLSCINRNYVRWPIAPGPLYSREVLKMFEQMPRTWFMPSMAENLQNLELKSHNYWGWHPKLDLEDITPALPNLKKLSLWRFVFSLERQAQWIASLGRSNSSGGLEGLHLHKCQILFGATHLEPLDRDTGYLVQEDMLRAVLLNGEQLQCSFFTPRWYTILDIWRESMPALTSFQLNRYTHESDFTAQKNRRIGSRVLGYTFIDFMRWPIYLYVPDVPPPGETGHLRPGERGCLEMDEEAADLLFSAVRSRNWPASRQNV